MISGDEPIIHVFETSVKPNMKKRQKNALNPHAFRRDRMILMFYFNNFEIVDSKESGDQH